MFKCSKDCNKGRFHSFLLGVGFDYRHPVRHRVPVSPNTIIQFWMTVIGLLWSFGAILDVNSTVPVPDDGTR